MYSKSYTNFSRDQYEHIFSTSFTHAISVIKKGKENPLVVGAELIEKPSSFNNWDFKWMVTLKTKHLFFWAVKLFSSFHEVGNTMRKKAKSKLEVISHTGTKKCTCTWLVLHRPLARLDVLKKGFIFNLNNSVSVWLQIQKSNINHMPQ